MCEYCPRYSNSFVEACYNGDFEAVKLALEEGVNPNAQGGANNDLGDTPLMVACFEACRIELYKSNKKELSLEDKEQFLKENDVKIVKLLLDKGADINCVSFDADRTVLMEACAKGAIEMVRLFLAYGADVDVVTEIDGKTALMLACYNDHLEVVKLLLEHGADRYIDNKDEKDALRIAKDLGHAAIVELLSKKNITES